MFFPMKKINLNLVKMILVLFLAFADPGVSVRITKLNIPKLVEPSDVLVLDCHYDMEREELHSVKWYKDEEEFFRYMPRQQPHVMSFPVAGVHTSSPQCSITQCNVQLTQLNTAHSSGAYKCEVSTEAPKFHVGFSTQNVTVAALGSEPHIEGLQPLYSLAELMYVNCTVSNADPTPILSWLVNGVPVPTQATQHTTPPNLHGLVSTWRTLRFHVERKHFPTPDRMLRVQCVAKQPGVPVQRTSPVISTRLYDPTAAAAAAVATHQQQISNQASFQMYPQGTEITIFVLTISFVAFHWR